VGSLVETLLNLPNKTSTPFVQVPERGEACLRHALVTTGNTSPLCQRPHIRPGDEGLMASCEMGKHQTLKHHWSIRICRNSWATSRLLPSNARIHTFPLSHSTCFPLSQVAEASSPEPHCILVRMLFLAPDDGRKRRAR
jgi:hypothetical protein